MSEQELWRRIEGPKEKLKNFIDWMEDKKNLITQWCPQFWRDNNISVKSKIWVIYEINWISLKLNDNHHWKQIFITFEFQIFYFQIRVKKTSVESQELILIIRFFLCSNSVEIIIYEFVESLLSRAMARRLHINDWFEYLLVWMSTNWAQLKSLQSYPNPMRIE